MSWSDYSNKLKNAENIYNKISPVRKFIIILFAIGLFILWQWFGSLGAIIVFLIPFALFVGLVTVIFYPSKFSGKK